MSKPSVSQQAVRRSRLVACCRLLVPLTTVRPLLSRAKRFDAVHAAQVRDLLYRDQSLQYVNGSVKKKREFRQACFEEVWTRAHNARTVTNGCRRGRAGPRLNARAAL